MFKHTVTDSGRLVDTEHHLVVIDGNDDMNRPRLWARILSCS